MDSRGYVRIVGRLKEMIVTGGINVFPAEIEAAIAQHPSVAEVAVIGVADRRWGEMVVGVVRPADDVPRDAAALEAFARERLAPYKVPKRWVFADELPITASGKVQKFLVRERVEREGF
jgi:fatty-acyl-CoA synthase